LAAVAAVAAADKITLEELLAAEAVQVVVQAEEGK
jgi:hypothetical protein